MIKWIQENRKSFIGVFAVLLVALLMTSFGVNFGQETRERDAIKVNDTKVSYADFHEQLRAIEDQYRRMLGANFERFAASLKLSDQLVDRLISQTLLSQKAHEWGFRVDDEEVRQILLQSGMFPGGFDPEIYKAFLQRRGMTSGQYEEELRTQALASQFVNLIDDLTYVSNAELQSLISEDGTKFDLRYVVLDPATFVDKVPAPTDEQIKEYYEQNSADFETKPEVSYEYVLFNPKDFTDAVEVQPEDIELYYVDHEKSFSTQEEVKVRHIQISVESNADGTKREAAKKKAEEIRAKAVAGESFDSLVKSYSEDYTTKDLGGDLGWMTRNDNKMGQTFKDAAFALKNGGISDVVISGVGYHIISVDSYKPPRIKGLDEVKVEIEKKLREEQAPTYTVEKAHQFFDDWNKGTAQLKDVAAQNSLAPSSTNGRLSADSDPAGLAGLTKNILATPEEKHQIHELGEQVAVVSITEYRAADVLPLSQVKDQVVAALKKGQSSGVTKSKAQDLVQQFADGKLADLKAAAAVVGAKVEEKKAVKRYEASEQVFNLPDVQKELFSQRQINAKPARYYESQGKYYLLQLAAITPPTAEEVAKEIKNSRESHKEQVKGEMLSALVSKLKSEANIVVSPDIMVR